MNISRKETNYICLRINKSSKLNFFSSSMLFSYKISKYFIYYCVIYDFHGVRNQIQVHKYTRHKLSALRYLPTLLLYDCNQFTNTFIEHFCIQVPKIDHFYIDFVLSLCVRDTPGIVPGLLMTWLQEPVRTPIMPSPLYLLSRPCIIFYGQVITMIFASQNVLGNVISSLSFQIFQQDRLQFLVQKVFRMHCFSYMVLVLVFRKTVDNFIFILLLVYNGFHLFPVQT